MNFLVREAVNEDYEGVSALTIEIHNLHVKNRPDVYEDVENPLQIERFHDLLNNSNVKIFVVENATNKELAAYSIVQIMSTQSIALLKQKKFCYIDDFCVKAKYKRNGIGRLLFKNIIDYAKAEGASSLQLVVWEFNKDAINFYKKMGLSTRNRRMEMNL